MVSCVACFFTLGLVSAFSIVSMDARSWDIAVTIGQHIDFYSQNGTKTGRSTIPGARSLTGLAYDSKTRTMYVSDGRNVSVFMYDNDQNETESKSDLFKQSETGGFISDIAFDPTTRTLFWIDNNPQALMMMKVDENTSQPKILHNLEGLFPWGLALDICNRYIYWTNGNHEKHSIERSRLDGTERKVIVTENLLNPYGIAVDHEDGKLYWTNKNEGVHFTVGRSNLDGTNNEKLIHDTQDHPLYVAVDRQTVYWSDQSSKCIQKTGKVKKSGEEGTMFHSYRRSNPLDKIGGVIARDNIDDIDCKAILERQKNGVKNDETSTPIPQSSSVASNDMSDTENKNSIGQAEVKCFNNGSYDEQNAACSCREGFTGTYCERDVCDGYCLNDGSCSLNISGYSVASCRCKEGFTGLRCERNVCEGHCLNYGTCSVSLNAFGQSNASCSCENGFTGPRCERDVCSGYCLNNGTCAASSSVSGQPVPSCSCKEGFTGPNCQHNVCDGYCLNNGSCSVSSSGEPTCKCNNFRGSRCEYSIELDKLCSLYCMGTEDMLETLNISLCRCDEGMESISGHIPDTELGTQSTIILSVLIAVIGILIITVGVLSYHVHKLRRRPRIRKRFVVSKGGVTPLTSRPQVPADSCEITIENCCNMNICETPCFEPKLRNPSSKTNSTKREEINSLLDSMEGADSC